MGSSPLCLDLSHSVVPGEVKDALFNSRCVWDLIIQIMTIFGTKYIIPIWSQSSLLIFEIQFNGILPYYKSSKQHLVRQGWQLLWL